MMGEKRSSAEKETVSSSAPNVVLDEVIHSQRHDYYVIAYESA